MNINITNRGMTSVPIVLGTTAAGDPLALLEQGATHTIADDAVNVVSVGDNPSFVEEVFEALGSIAEALKRIAWWRDHKPTLQEGEPGVVVTIDNTGANDLRVLLDANVNETFIPAGTSNTVQAERYVEIREQGV